MSEIRNELKSFFTKHWLYLAVQTACKLNIFDLVEKKINTLEKINQKLDSDKYTLEILLKALTNNGFLILKDHYYSLSEKSTFLTDSNSKSLKNACILWGMEHMDAWQNLEKTIQTGKPAFQTEQENYFEYLSANKDKLNNYHLAMQEYAKDDYINICDNIDFSSYTKIMDIGGGLGTLINIVKKNKPKQHCILFEKPEVIDLVSYSNIEKVKGDFFKEIPKKADCLILSRVIHDWEDTKAILILKNCYNSLEEDGTIILIENLTNKIKDEANLLSLNMKAICKSFERSENQYRTLLNLVGFSIEKINPLNSLQHIIIAKK